MSEKAENEGEKPDVRKGHPSVQLDRQTFRARFLERFYDPAFEDVKEHVDAVEKIAWEAYEEYRKSPRTRRAGEGFAHPDAKLPVEWLEARSRIAEAQRRHDDEDGPTRVLVVCGASRSDQTCPGETSKTLRLARIATEVIEEAEVETEMLDLSRLASEYGRNIHPCKACVSTAMPLCHWPCSCYPNHALGQVQDWMNDIYPMWVAAHGILIVAPVYWYMAPSPLKLMIDRLVCADGGNPDPTTTKMKDPAKAKEVELAGWDYPKHLAGRAFSVVVHGDAAGVEASTNALHDWLVDMELLPSGASGTLGRYVGYYGPYATSHAALDADEAVQEETRNAARSLVATVKLVREGRYPVPDADISSPRPK
jgi:multimeric flavodoxin WrbA